MIVNVDRHAPASTFGLSFFKATAPSPPGVFTSGRAIFLVAWAARDEGEAFALFIIRNARFRGALASNYLKDYATEL